MKPQLLAVALAGAISQVTIAQDTEFESDTDKLSYGLGMVIGERVLKNYGELNYDILVEAMTAQNEGSDTKMTLEEAQTALQEAQQRLATERAEAAKTAGIEYLAENAEKDGVTVTDSGLQYEVMIEGDGPKPSLDDTVSVHYVGTLINGTEFDSSISRGEPTSFALKGVIPGWTEGVQLMNVGSKFKFTIPSDLAYGDRGAGQSIGPGETLVFEVELLEIQGK